MKIVSTSENKDYEKRIAITPEIAKKYISSGFEVSICKNYGQHLGFSDKEYEKLGTKVIDDEKKIIESADIIVQLALPSDDKLNYFKDNQNLIGILNPYENKEKINKLINRKIKNFSLELLPRITRAQSMDILS